MSNDKITAQQAFEAAKVLWPDATHITGYYTTRKQIRINSGFVVEAVLNREVDWPVGVTQWPMPLPEWRDAKFPEDFGKIARFKDGSQADWCENGRTLCGYVEGIVCSWVDNRGVMWCHCQVRDETDTNDCF